MSNLRDRFELSVKENSGRIAIQYRAEGAWKKVSYLDLGDRVRRMASLLDEEGIKKGDRVAILMKNRPEWPVTFFSAVSLGAVAVPLDIRATERELRTILADSDSSIIIAEEDTVLNVKDAGIRVLSVDSEALLDKEKSLGGELKTADVAQKDTACLLYTSGTTATPKGVMLSHNNLISNSSSLRRLGLITEKDNVISVLPLHHAYPLTVTMILPLLSGSGIIYPESIRPEDISESMQNTGATVFVGVPQIFGLFYQKISDGMAKIPFPLNVFVRAAIRMSYSLRKRTGVNLARYLFAGLHRKFGRSMRVFVSGGAKLDENVEEGFIRLGFTVLEGYGLTETSPVLTVTPLNKPKIGSAGKPIPDVEIKLKDKDREGVGEVLARGPNIMQGYYNRTDLTEQVIKDGWFSTGDLGYVDDEGYLFLTGRCKDVIVLSSGMNVYPEEVEEVYMAEAPLKEMCVFEAPVKRGEEEVLGLGAVVVPDLAFFKKYGEVNLENVIRERFDNVSRTLPGHMRLIKFLITLDDLPRTLLGKIKRFEVKRDWGPKMLSGQSEPVQKEIAEEDREMMATGLGKRVIELLKGYFRVKSIITPSSLLELDLGIDSLGRIELLSMLERAFGREIKDEVVGEAFTVRDLIEGLKPFAPEDVAIGSGDLAAAGWHDQLQVPPGDENRKRIDLTPGIFAWIAGFLFLLPIWLFFKLFYSFKVEGQENIPDEGPYILYGNHTSYFDGFLIACAMPRFPNTDLFLVGFRPYFNVPVIRSLVKTGRIIPLDFSAHLLEALKSCYYVLTNGKNLCLFPEGLRTLDGEIGKFKKGFGILAEETGAKLVPVAIEGAYEAWPRTSRYPKRHPIKVVFGKPFDPKTLESKESKPEKEKYDIICDEARDTLATLKRSIRA